MSISKIKTKNIIKVLGIFFIISIFILPIKYITSEETPQKEIFYFMIFSDMGDQKRSPFSTQKMCEEGRKNQIDEIDNHKILKWWENISVSMCYREGPALNTDTKYQLLEPLPDGNGGEFKNFESKQSPDNPCAFGNYLNIMIKFIIGIAAVLAMIMIIKGGFEYMASSLPSEKESGKGTITNAIFGLLLALGAWIILFTINPDLLNFCNIGTPIKVEEITK
jgi:hypothetical protein